MGMDTTGNVPHRVQISLSNGVPEANVSSSAWGGEKSARAPSATLRARSARTRVKSANSVAAAIVSDPLGSSEPATPKLHASQPAPSPAVTKMKAMALQKERDVIKYMQKYTTSPYASKSAKSNRRGSAGSAILSVGASSAPLPSSFRPKSAGTVPTKKSGNKGTSRGQEHFDPLHGYKDPTFIGSPVAAKLMASARDGGVPPAGAHTLGAALDTFGGNVFSMVRAGANALAPAEAGQSEATPSLPRPPSLPSQFPTHSLNSPVGAHSAGYYSKLALANAVTSSRPMSAITIPPINSPPKSAKRHQRTGTFDGVVTEEGEDSSAEQPHRLSRTGIRLVTGPFEEPYENPTSHTKQHQFHVSDLSLLDQHLCTLTEIDSPIETLLESLNALMSVCEEDESMSSTLLFDRGAVTILLSLMDHFHDIPDIQSKSCFILEHMGNKNPLTLQSISKQGGISLLLRAVQRCCQETSSAQTNSNELRNVVNNDMATLTPTSRSINKRGKKPIPANSRSNSRNNLNRTQSIGSASSIASLAADDVGNSNPNHKAISSAMPMGTFRTVNTSQEFNPQETLMEGLLQKYFDPRFSSQLEKMDKTTRAEIIKHLLLIFRKVDKLLAVSGLISLDINLEEAIDQIVSESGQMLQSELILLYLVDPETGELIATSYDPWMDPKEKELMEQATFPAGTGIAGYVVQKDEIVNIKDVSNNEQFVPEVDARSGDDTIDAHSILSVPIKNREGVIKGVLQAVNKIGPNELVQQFNHEDEFLLRTIGRQAGIIISNSQIYEQMKKTQKKVEVLLETTRSLGSTLQLEKLVNMIMDAAKELLAADRCTIFLVDPRGKYLITHVQGQNSMQEIRIPANTGIAGHVFTSGNSVNIHDAYKDSRFNPEVDRQTGYVTRNILCVPIKNINGQSIGVTQMINRKRGSFDLDDEKMLISFSAQAAVTIEKSVLFKKTEDMLKETQQMKNYLMKILQSITNVVITLDSQGFLSTINHPAKLEVESMLEIMQTQHYTIWLGKDNATLVADIQRAYDPENGTVIAQDYELNLGGKLRNVNYTIVQMTSDNSKDTGVVIVFEDISSEKRALMTLGRYMSPALAKQVMAEDGGQLGGKRKKVSILFSDIRSFTTLSESMEPHEVVELLNHHFSDAVNAIMSEQGILDKYIGDAVMAVFGVPFVSAEDAIHACNAALRMKESLALFNETRAKAGQKQIKIGIGINTGMVLSGNIGSTKRMEFSCIGDAVNLASRIEGLTKYYGLTILITEYTLKETGDQFITREIDQVVVSGKSLKVGIYELLGRRDGFMADNILSAVAMYNDGMAKYRRRQFQEAEKIFNSAIEIADDGPSKTMAHRCQTYQQKSPPADWNGVYVSESK